MYRFKAYLNCKYELAYTWFITWKSYAYIDLFIKKGGYEQKVVQAMKWKTVINPEGMPIHCLKEAEKTMEILR